MSSDRDNAVSILRACLLSSKSGIGLNILNRDFKSLVGTPIPYESLGYATVEDFLRSIKDVLLKFGPKGEVIVHAAPSDESAHIASLVKRQKSNQKKRIAVPSFGRSRKPNLSWHPNHYPAHSNFKPGPPLKNQLSITVNNEFHNTSRTVSIKSKSLTAIEEKAVVKHKYELPPRLQKVKDEHSVPSPVNEPNLKNGSNEFDSVGDLSFDFEENCDINGLNELSNFDLYQTGLGQKSRKGIMSPYSPGYAVAAGRAQTQALAKELEDSYNNIKNYNELEQPDVYDNTDYNLEVAPWNRVKPGMDLPNSTVSDKSYILKLFNFCQTKGWPDPEYKIITRCLINGEKKLGCQVKVRQDHFSSYPDESTISEEAKEFAAKKAYQQLIENDIDAIGNDLPITTDLSLIQSRVHQLVSEGNAGIWATSIPERYRTRFNELLPIDWLKTASTFSNIILNTICEGKVIVFPNVSVAVGREIVDDTPPVKPTTENRVQPGINAQVVSSENNWDVFVTHVVSTDDIWVRIIGKEYSEQYESLSHQMDLYYMGKVHQMESPPRDLCVKGYYAAKISDEYSSRDSWHRVYVEEINWDTKTAEVWLVDNGEYVIVTLNMIFDLVDKFCDLPRQAVSCSLANLEHHVDDDDTLLDILTKLLVGKVLVAQVVNRDTLQNKYSLIFYDTTGEDDINVNEELINRAIFSSKPQLPEKEGVKEVYISHINENGLLFVQIQTNAFYHLQKLINTLSVDQILEHRCCSSKHLSGEKIYLAKFDKDDKWYRAVITRMPSVPEKQVEVKFIDFGNMELVDISNISHLELISNVLSRMPPQALPVLLHGVEVGVKEYAQIKKMIPYSDSVLLKVIISDSIPKVEIFKRTAEPEGGGALISINNSINFEKLKFAPKRQSSLRRSKSLTRTVPSPTLNPVTHSSTVYMSLSPPVIPTIGSDFFDIFVTMAANPSNFIVQPLQNINSLKELAAQMKMFYNNKETGNLVSSENLVEGGLYAASFENNEWYRVTLSSVLGKRASVHSCDFGEYTVVSTTSLRYLAPQFTELSYQGIKAKLTGIKPMHTDWLVEDCVRFQELVVEKQLVSIVMEKGKDELNPVETVLGLQIIDTSTDEDVLIAKVLVEEKRAILTDTIKSDK